MEVEETIHAKFLSQIESLMAKTTSEIVKVFVEVLMETRVEITRSWREIDELKQKLEESEERRAEVVLRSEVALNFKREMEEVLVSQDVVQTPKDTTVEHTGSNVEDHESATLQASYGAPDIDQSVNSPNQTQEAQEAKMSQTLQRPKAACQSESFGVREHQQSLTESDVSKSPLQAVSLFSPPRPSCSSSTLASDSLKTEALAFTSDCLAAEEIQDEKPAVDEKGIPGFHHVERLADYLVELRNLTTVVLTNLQVSTIIDLWLNLDSWDKQQVGFVALHQERLTTGHFQSPGKEDNLLQGMVNTARCTLEASSSTRPDCCRLIEAIFIRLCSIHGCPSKKDEGILKRWTLIMQDYRKIRELLLGNGAVMQATSLQLVEVKQNALIQWHNHRIKDQGLTELLKEDLSPSLQEAEKPRIQARTLPIDPTQHQNHKSDFNVHIRNECFSELLKKDPSSSLQQAEKILQARTHPTELNQHQLPAFKHRPLESTAGQPILKRRAVCEPPTIRPKLPTQRELFGPDPKAAQYLQMVPQISVRAAPVLQAVHMLQPLPAFVCGPTQNGVPQCATQESPSQPRQKRAYNRVVQGNTCKKCGQFRSAVTGHSQYKGIIYCPKTETMDKKQWLDYMRRKWK
ncbi:uncharacterized protein LOC103031077 [Astyanax mexicanus]|uniref:uncharacterized protein LOC103031077 n=1 Tax=Astyanax mexicanus TaxID=7994 RepID=UPI0020CAFB16|nr:uncharacterized protein LOC103031077 [Astyanax mexicanus]